MAILVLRICRDVEATIVSLADVEERASLTLHPALDRDELTEATQASDWDFENGLSNFSGPINNNSACVTSVP